jgi:hypothetical protein
MRTTTLALALLLPILTIPAHAVSKRRAASPDRCSVTVAPGSLNVPAAGIHTSVSVTMTGGCAISPVSSASWVTAAPGTGSITIDVAANTATTSRSAIVHVRSALIVVTQAANDTKLLKNSGFDSGTTNWSEAFSGPGSVSVGQTSPIVAPGPAETAVMITSTAAGSGHQLSQCVSVTGGKTFEAGSKIFIPSGQSAGVVNFAVYEYWVPGCPAPGTPYHQRRELSAPGPIGQWFDLGTTWSSDFSTKSVLVVIGAGGSNTPPFSAWFDNVFIREK